jgi:hypothetical protein
MNAESRKLKAESLKLAALIPEAPVFNLDLRWFNC